MQIDLYLQALIEKDASDLHFIAGQPPRMRQYGELAAFEFDEAGMVEVAPKAELVSPVEFSSEADDETSATENEEDTKDEQSATEQ